MKQSVACHVCIETANFLCQSWGDHIREGHVDSTVVSLRFQIYVCNSKWWHHKCNHADQVKNLVLSGPRQKWGCSYISKKGTISRATKPKPMCFVKVWWRVALCYCCRWVQGSKSLSLNHVVNILLTLKRTNDWEKAFTRNVPTRKFRADW